MLPKNIPSWMKVDKEPWDEWDKNKATRLLESTLARLNKKYSPGALEWVTKHESMARCSGWHG